MSQPIRILIADSDTTYAKNLQRFLSTQAGLKVINIVRDGQGAVNVCKEALPDLVLMDLHLPVLDSIRAIGCILDQNERIKILGLSSGSSDRYVVEAIKAGASGCIDKYDAASHRVIVEAIRRVEKGEVLLNPWLAISIIQEFRRLSDAE